MDRRKAGERLRKGRVALGCTGKQFAKKLGVSANYLLSVERGERQFSLETFRKACRLAGVSTDWALGISEHGGVEESKLPAVTKKKSK